tara:strand:+ start:697 stop:1761 length:1065 start_codon:yes stop_codon:yes gene_type:complete
MKKKNSISKSKVTQIKSKKPKLSKKRLGMGLSSLLSTDTALDSIIRKNPSDEERNLDLGNSVQKVADKIKMVSDSNSSLSPSTEESQQIKLPIHSLVSGKYQPRKTFDQAELEELAESIKVNGILQPILVRPLTNNAKSYEIIAGERRWRASQIAKVHSVPVIIRNFDDETAMGVAMIENLQRSDLNIIEEAEGYRTMMNNFQFTQEKLSDRIGKSRSHIANVLRILSLPKFVKRYVSSGEISFGHARTMVTLSDLEANDVANEIIDKDLSVRETEKLVGKIKKRFNSVKEGSSVSSENEKDPNIALLERELTNLLGLKVDINHKANNSGSLAIFYKSIDQIQPVLDKLKWKPK